MSSTAPNALQRPTSSDPVAVAEYLLKLREASSSFLGFVQLLYPDYKLADFQLELIQILDLLERNELKHPTTNLPVQRILVNMPPRHSKTFLCTTLFPVYYLARDPMREVMSTAYNGELARTFGRSVRELCKEPVIRQAFPDFDLNPDSSAVDHWRTTQNGVYYGIGIDGTTTGRAANLLIVDDPIKNRTEADSITYRNQTWSSYVSALSTRKQPTRRGDPPIEVVIHTRWHPDDLAGRIMETPDWKNNEWIHVNFQAIRTKPKIQLDRNSLPKYDKDRIHTKQRRRINSGHVKQGLPIVSASGIPQDDEVALWPERFPLSYLHKLRDLDRREFEALYQQLPYIVGGNIIRASWFKTYSPTALEDANHPDHPNFISVIISADTAFKIKEQNDFSVLIAAGITTLGDIYILDILRMKCEFPNLKRNISHFSSRFKGRGLRGLYIEDKASGQSLIQELRKDSGIPVIPYKNHADKVARVNSITPIIEGGRVFLPTTAPWLDNFITEVQQFPSSPFDDQVDALTIILDVLSRVPTNTSELLTAPITSLSDSNAFGTLNFNQPVLSPTYKPQNWFNNRNALKPWGE